MIKLMEKPNESLVRLITDGVTPNFQYDGEDFFLNGEKISSSKELNRFGENWYLEGGVQVKEVIEIEDEEENEDETSIEKASVVRFSGDLFPFKSFLWFVMNGHWHDEFINVDGKEGSQYYFDLLPAHYEIEKCDYSLVELENLFEFDEQSGDLFWFSQSSKSSLWNMTFPYESAIKIIKGERLVEIFGKFYSYYEVISIMGVELSSDGDKYTSGFVSARTTEEKFGREKIDSCFYCGDNTMSLIERYEVNSCKECNKSLGDRSFSSVEEEALFLGGHYAEKYRKALRTGEFGEEELGGFGRNMHSMISSNLNLKDYVLARISHCHEVAGSIFNASSLNSLSSSTLEAKRSAYQILEDFLYSDLTIKKFAAKVAEEFDEDIANVEAVLKEKLHYDAAIQLKYDYGYPLDSTVQQIRTALKSSKDDSLGS